MTYRKAEFRGFTQHRTKSSTHRQCTRASSSSCSQNGWAAHIVPHTRKSGTAEKTYPCTTLHHKPHTRPNPASDLYMQADKQTGSSFSCCRRSSTLLANITLQLQAEQRHSRKSFRTVQYIPSTKRSYERVQTSGEIHAICTLPQNNLPVFEI